MAKGILSAIKQDVERRGSNIGKFFYVKSGAKGRVRFLQDMDEGIIVRMHDRWDPQLKVPCRKNYDEDAECEFCDMEGVRTRDMYAWSIWDYDANEVKLFMYAANQCSPVPNLVALYETYGSLTDRDFTISRTGSGTNTSYALVGLDKASFRNSKAKPFSDKIFWEVLDEAFPDPNRQDDEEKKSKKSTKQKKQKAVEEDDLPWDDEELGEYEGKSPRELYALCNERDIKVKPKMPSEYYIKKLEEADELELEEDEDDDFWGDE